ncbi:MAG: NYN domain-containing protein [Acidovorax sp.]|nr:NYN domain-containing protein [Acidovorax sp.]
MASPTDSISMALFCDFENVALGVRDAQYEKFDIKPILERLLLKGSIVVKKAYCDWERYKGFKATMHEANFELIEIPHVRQSGKNSADIRLVVDALDLCYTKSHVDTFVIISGDSDFSPLVSKLRENNKQVIGVGVKQSTSDLLIANCDEFIFYDDLVRENQRAQARRQNLGSNNPPAPRRSPEEERHRKESQDERRTQGVELAVETFEALLSERGDSGKIWASVLKEAIKRRKPDFSEGYYSFRTFGNLLEEAQARGLLEFGRDEKSGAYVYRSMGQSAGVAPATRQDAPAERQGHSMPARHDFHAVAIAPERSGREPSSPSGRSRGRRGEPSGRADARTDAHTDTRREVGTESLEEVTMPGRDELRAELHEPFAEEPTDRPVSRYFSAAAAPVAPSGDTTADAEVYQMARPALQTERSDLTAAAAAQASMVTGQGQHNDEAGETIPASRPRSRARSGANQVEADKGPAARTRRAKGTGVAEATSGAIAPAFAQETSPPDTRSDVDAQAPAKAAGRPRSRARKPAEKPAE